MALNIAQDTGENSLTDTLWHAVSSLRDSFHLSDEEMMMVLGKMPQSSYYRGLSQGTVRFDHDRTKRVSLLLGIYKALRIIFVDSQQAMTWIDRENALPPFNGRPPRDYMVSGDYLDLARVRQFLDYWRG